MEPNPDLGKSSTGIQANLAALLCYALGWVSGLIFYLVEKENKFVRFHAFQSMVVFGFFTVLIVFSGFVPVLGWMIMPVAYLLQTVLWILLMVKAYQGVKFKLPVAGDMAEQNTQ